MKRCDDLTSPAVYKPLKNQIAIERLPKPSTSGMIILVSARVKPKDDRLFLATKLQFVILRRA